ncbi:hypothetical protein SAMN05421812_1033 [Asanoa hainanensis]|uniref:4-amino-4-deoxy-L-arabinose transferase n=1 Tax=Asanoa hainanensis TaxID=560556 RepID=A0A239JK33_9ACTN|nr:hypothetical protein [Asanoa hainanensis]SNT06396.1 hypothetical protein SAMN05421812_1033 [Asanoa hainanensis]
MAILTGAQTSTPAVSPATGRRRPGAAVLTALALGLAGLGFRIAVLLADAPPTNSDEGTMGLAALHIGQGNGLPVYFYGQNYMGTLEAYLAAPLVALANGSVLALRMPNLLLYAAFLAAMWALTRRLYSPWFATFVVGLLALGSDRVLKNQLISGGGYPEINPAGAALVLLAVGLAVRPRTAGYAAFGLIAGLMLWVDWLVLPYLAAASCLLLLKKAAKRSWIALAAGVVLGAAPLVIHDLTSSWKHSAIPTFLGLNGGGIEASWADRLHGGVLTGIPLATGLCAPGRCEPWQLWWAPAWLILLAVAGFAAWRSFRTRADRVASAGEPAGRAASPPDRVRAAGRLALVAAALVSLVVYARSNAAGNTPIESGRYLHCLLISTPAVLWPLWTLRGRVTRWLGAAGLAVVCAFSLVATGMVVHELPRIAAVDDRQVGLLAELDRRGVTYVYSEYWTCNYIAYISSERVRCAVIAADLTPGFDRYQPYKKAVAEAPTRTFALPTGSPESQAVRDYLDSRQLTYAENVASGYDIFQPTTRVDLPLPD